MNDAKIGLQKVKECAKKGKRRRSNANQIKTDHGGSRRIRPHCQGSREMVSHVQNEWEIRKEEK